MKSRLPFFALMLFFAACDEQEGSDLPSPCEVDTPVMGFTYEPGKAILTWDDIGEYKYHVTFYAKGSPDEIYTAGNGMSADTFAVISSAHPGTAYQAQMEVSKGDIPLAINRCNGVIEEQVFTPPCAPYDRLSISSITASTAMANWERVGKPDGKAFTVNLRKKGTTDITTNSTDAEGLKLSSLSAKTEYEAQLAFTCTDNEIYVTDWVSFTTL